MVYFCCAWEMVEWPNLTVASLSAGMRGRSLSHPWALARITSDTLMFKGKAEWKRGRDQWGISSEESLSMTPWLPWQSVKRPISSACPSLPVFPAQAWAMHNFLRLWATSCFFWGLAGNNLISWGREKFPVLVTPYIIPKIKRQFSGPDHQPQCLHWQWRSNQAYSVPTDFSFIPVGPLKAVNAFWRMNKLSVFFKLHNGATFKAMTVGLVLCR